MIAGLGVAAGADDAPLHATNPRIQVELRGQGLGRELILGDVRVKRLGVQENGVSAHRLHDGDAPIEQQVAQIEHLAHAGPHVVILYRFDNADGQGFHVTPCHAAVGVETLVDHNHVAKRIEQVVVVDGQPATDVDQVVLLSAHPGTVGVAAEFLEDGSDGLIGVALLSLLDEETVLDHAGGVQVDGNAVVIAQRPQCPHVGHAHRLASGHVHRARQADIGDVLGSHSPDQGPQLVQVYVAFEGVRAAGIMGLVYDHVHKGAASQFLV